MAGCNVSCNCGTNHACQARQSKSFLKNYDFYFKCSAYDAYQYDKPRECHCLLIISQPLKGIRNENFAGVLQEYHLQMTITTSCF